MRSELSARLVAAHPLPGVRAGSALVRVGDRLLAVQDDAFCAAWIDLPGLGVTRLPLSGDGVALAKKDKPDFESALRAPDGSIRLLGSGSLENRCTLARIDPDDGSVTLHEFPAIYDSVRLALGLADRPNIEGAAVDGSRLRLFHRGAGSAASACVDLPLGVLDGDRPQVLGFTWFELGTLDGVGLGVTDAAVLSHDRTMFLAAAELTDDAIADGPVAGAAVGLIDGVGDPLSVRWTRLLESDGRPSVRKVEGLAVDDDLGGGWLITDPDDPTRSAELCRVELDGIA
ncbi:hypothetical protein FCG67_05650 [Rhodococcus oryzae]|uniref:DUF3616 domain-containing protein n=1 Tax=Rhodococcus oryzae TaxID=2571143 RepID=A0ABY2RPF2_9NOCA|nr:hypothetical protein [Rhodococcus oryzae]TJZ80342.1 hypothetical protein FCG67_05650 [Rhodococcus oryzae]